MHNYFLALLKTIYFVKPNATDDEINDVIQKSACQNLLLRAENGLNTTAKEELKFLVEKNNVYQFCSFTSKPRLLLFDEATSAPDSLLRKKSPKPYEVFHLKKIR
jgi:ATP-binding cassette subfamily B protein